MRLCIALFVLISGCTNEGVPDPQSEPGPPAKSLQNVQIARQDTLKLDHVPIVVRSLGKAVTTYNEDLGFTIKPGRLHPNSINNAHVKFADGTALELITSKEPTDELAAHYLGLLAAGEGGAFLSLNGGDVDSIVQKPAIQRFNPNLVKGSYANTVTFDFSVPIGYWFFLEYTRPPVDKAEYLVHENKALGIEAVWLAGANLIDEQALLSALGRDEPASIVIPGLGMKGDTYILNSGSIYLFTKEGKPNTVTPVFGASIRVERIDETHRYLSNQLAKDLDIHSGIRGKSVIVNPQYAHGMWLEFIELKK